jgi:hypothetical protein
MSPLSNPPRRRLLVSLLLALLLVPLAAQMAMAADVCQAKRAPLQPTDDGPLEWAMPGGDGGGGCAPSPAEEGDPDDLGRWEPWDPASWAKFLLTEVQFLIGR